MTLIEIFGAPVLQKQNISTSSVFSFNGVVIEILQVLFDMLMVIDVQLHVSEKRRISMCVGCGSQIQDQYILRVAPDLEWHASCLKCADCDQYLDESCTCFVRDGKTYCKRDYVR